MDRYSGPSNFIPSSRNSFSPLQSTSASFPTQSDAVSPGRMAGGSSQYFNTAVNSLQNPPRGFHHQQTQPYSPPAFFHPSLASGVAANRPQLDQPGMVAYGVSTARPMSRAPPVQWSDPLSQAQASGGGPLQGSQLNHGFFQNPFSSHSASASAPLGYGHLSSAHSRPVVRVGVPHITSYNPSPNYRPALPPPPPPPPPPSSSSALSSGLGQFPASLPALPSQPPRFPLPPSSLPPSNSRRSQASTSTASTATSRQNGSATSQSRSSTVSRRNGFDTGAGSESSAGQSSRFGGSSQLNGGGGASGRALDRNQVASSSSSGPIASSSRLPDTSSSKKRKPFTQLQTSGVAPSSTSKKSKSVKSGEIFVHGIFRHSNRPRDYESTIDGVTPAQAAQSRLVRYQQDVDNIVQQAWNPHQFSSKTYILIGSALDDIRAIRRYNAVPPTNDVDAFLRAVPFMNYFAGIGADSIGSSATNVRDAFVSQLPPNARLAFSIDRGDRVLVMTKEELLTGLNWWIADQEGDVSVTEDVLEYLQLIQNGWDQRMAKSESNIAMGGELHRVSIQGGKQYSKQHKKHRGRNLADRDAQPAGWSYYVRCGRGRSAGSEGCLAVGTKSGMKKHRRLNTGGGGGRRTHCAGTCNKGGIFLNKTMAQQRSHISTQHPALKLCPVKTCSNAFVLQSALDDHAKVHTGGKGGPEGMRWQNEWITKERALTRPIAPEEASSPFPDLTGTIKQRKFTLAQLEAFACKTSVETDEESSTNSGSDSRNSSEEDNDYEDDDDDDD